MRPSSSAGDQFAIHDPGGSHAAAIAQTQEDWQQRMTRAVDLDAEIQGEPARWRIGDLHVAEADVLHQARAERWVDQRFANPAPAAPAGARRRSPPRLPRRHGHERRTPAAAFPPGRWPSASAPARPDGGISRAAASAFVSRRTKTTPSVVSARTNCRSSSKGMTAPS